MVRIFYSKQGKRVRPSPQSVYVCVKRVERNEKRDCPWAYEVHTDRGDERLCESVVCKAEQQRRLSDTRITDEEELEEVVTEIQFASGQVSTNR